MKFDCRYWEDVEATLVQFLDWVFTGRIVIHKPRVKAVGLAMVWTAPRYIDAEAGFLAELRRRNERRRRLQYAEFTALQRRLELERQAREIGERREEERKQRENGRENVAIQQASASYGCSAGVPDPLQRHAAVGP